MSGGPSLFDQARGAMTVEAMAGVKLRRAGREVRGPCPICGAGHKSKSGPFAVDPQRQTWKAYCGGAHPGRGDVVDLAAAMRGETLVEAARWIIGGAAGPITAKAKPKVEKPAGPTTGQKIWAEMWAGGRPITGTLAERYLLSRGILPEVVAAAAPRLRYHPFAKVAWDDRAKEWIKAPAMLAQAETPLGPTGGGHATYLLRDGSGRDKRRGFGKRMWGPQYLEREGGGIVQGGAWLIGPDGEGDLADAEGIESSLSLVSLALLKGGAMMRACAALSLDRLQGGVLLDDEGLSDLESPVADPDQPPFTWPNPPLTPWGRVIVGVDRDMSPIKARGRTGRGKVIPFQLDGEARARRCGRLAVAGWARAGSKAVAIAPPAGSDFNDELRREQARRGVAVRGGA